MTKYLLIMENDRLGSLNWKLLNGVSAVLDDDLTREDLASIFDVSREEIIDKLLTAEITEEFGDYVEKDDHSTALYVIRALAEEFGYIDRIESEKELIIGKMRSLQNPTDNYKSAHETLVELYLNYEQRVAKITNPAFHLMDINSIVKEFESYRNKSDDFDRLLARLEIEIPEN